MTLPVFVVEPAALGAEAILLEGDEGRHAARVKRLRLGEELIVTDGAGAGARCVVTAAGRDSLQLQLRSRLTEPAAVPRLVVVQALPKGERAELAVDLLTEVGADVIVPWAASRSVVTWRGDRGDRGLQRWRSTAVAAAKQSRRLRFPVVQPLHTTADLVAPTGPVATASAAYVLHEAAATSISGVAPPEGGDVVVLVGPEGGLDDSELAAFAAVGAVPVRLGSTVLRTSTAGVVAAAAVLSRSQRWS